MAIPITQTIGRGQTTLVNTPYPDISRGVSLEVHYGSSVRGSLNVSGQILSPNITYSDPIVMKRGSGALAVPTEIFDKNFDLTFGLPRTLKGTMIVNVPMGVAHDAAGGPSTVSVSGQIIVSKISNSVVEVLGTKSTSTWSDTIADGAQTAKMFSNSFTIPNTKFKKDDTLRVNVHLWGLQGGALRLIWGIGCDPQNRNDFDEDDSGFKAIPDSIPTIMTVQIPFRVIDI